MPFRSRVLRAGSAPSDWWGDERVYEMPLGELSPNQHTEGWVSFPAILNASTLTLIYDNRLGQHQRLYVTVAPSAAPATPSPGFVQGTNRGTPEEAERRRGGQGADAGRGDTRA